MRCRDNLSTGIKERIEAEIVELDIAAPDAGEKLTKLLSSRKFDSVIHLAARKQVGESVEIPERYFLDNIGGMANLLLAMRETNHESLVFSSSAATYRIPDAKQVKEDAPHYHCTASACGCSAWSGWAAAIRSTARKNKKRG